MTQTPEQRKAQRRRYRDSHPGRAVDVARITRLDNRLRETATQHCARWTSEETAIACDPSLTIVEAAEKLGRTYSAVKYRRSLATQVCAGCDYPRLVNADTMCRECAEILAGDGRG